MSPKFLALFAIGISAASQAGQTLPGQPAAPASAALTAPGPSPIPVPSAPAAAVPEILSCQSSYDIAVDGNTNLKQLTPELGKVEKELVDWTALQLNDGILDAKADFRRGADGKEYFYIMGNLIDDRDKEMFSAINEDGIKTSVRWAKCFSKKVPKLEDGRIQCAYVTCRRFRPPVAATGRTG